MGSACTKNYQQPAMDWHLAFAGEIEEYVKRHAPTRYVDTYDPEGGWSTRMCEMPPPAPRPTLVAPPGC